ncbi:hypothetical protein [Saccharomonospora iraqiensis]|uniref:hypothetical protein n=1 Tax=Saccharomonospora iraqiensis TaxID=52698 RepID=UPI00022E1CF0|nr:hypothetical protein [Saccharomonospora iraqiensis]
MDPHAELSRGRWHVLDEVLAEVCERTSGRLEDLHDRAVGILESVRLDDWRREPDAGSVASALLWTHVRRVIGSLVHLEDAAPDDVDAIRATGCEVRALAEHLCAYPAPG